MPTQMIQFTTKSVLRVVVGTCLGGVLVAGAGVPALAQIPRPTPLEDLQTKDGSDFFNGRGNGQGAGIMNFIQNAIIGTPRSSDEFVADQRENFDEATSLFRKRQAEQLRKSQPAPDLQVAPLPSTPATPPSSN